MALDLGGVDDTVRDLGIYPTFEAMAIWGDVGSGHKRRANSARRFLRPWSAPRESADALTFRKRWPSSASEHQGKSEFHDMLVDWQFEGLVRSAVPGFWRYVDNPHSVASRNIPLTRLRKFARHEHKMLAEHFPRAAGWLCDRRVLFA